MLDKRLLFSDSYLLLSFSMPAKINAASAAVTRVTTGRALPNTLVVPGGSLLNPPMLSLSQLVDSFAYTTSLDASLMVPGLSAALAVPGGETSSEALEAQRKAAETIEARARDAAGREATEARVDADIEAQARALRVAALVKAGIASKMVERSRFAALQKAAREAVDESSEINAAIEESVAEADRLCAFRRIFGCFGDLRG